MSLESSNFKYYFLSFVLFLYILFYMFFNLNLTLVFSKFISIFKSLIPVFFLMFVITFLISYFVKPKILVKYLGGNSGVKGYLIAVISGIISTGPIYMWYPLLSDLRETGMKDSLILVFLYNRAVKLPLVPLMAVYFGFKYTLVLLFVMIFVSVIQGLIFESFSFFGGIKNE